MAATSRLVKITDLEFAISIVEFIIYPIATTLTVFAVMKIVRTALLPRIIRALICLTLLRIPTSILRRVYILSMRAFVYGEAEIPLQEINTHLNFFGWFIIATCSIAYSVHLIVASFYPIRAKKCNSHLSVIIVTTFILTVSATFALLKIPRSVIYAEIMAVSVAIAVLVMLFCANCRWRKTRVNDDLGAKTVFEENMRSIRLMVPLLLHENICHLITLAVMQVQAWLSQDLVVAGTIESPAFNNIFGMLLALEILCAPIILLVSINRMHKRQKILQALIENRNVSRHGHQYFEQLRNSWNQ